MVATYHVLKSDSYESLQKKIQISVAWLFPILGSVVIIVFALSDKEYVRELKSNSSLPARIFSLFSLAAFSSMGGSIASASDNNSDSGDIGGNGGDSSGGGDG